MVSIQPHQPPRTPLLRLLSPAMSDHDPETSRAGSVVSLPAKPLEQRTQEDNADAELAPFSYHDLADFEVPLTPEPISATGADTTAPEWREPDLGQMLHRQTGYLSGVSLSAVLQMLHLERKTCVVEVSARGWLGTLTLVNGELVDAAVGEISGEEAALIILNWSNAQSSIIDGVDLFRHTVQRPITSLIMDAVRIGDETGMLDPSRVGDDFEGAPVDASDWQWLVDSLFLTGANTARILTAGASETRQTGFLVDPTADLARGIRTWASLLGPDVSEVVVTRSDHIAILAMLDHGHSQFVYAEASGPETVDTIRRALRSIKS